MKTTSCIAILNLRKHQNQRSSGCGMCPPIALLFYFLILPAPFSRVRYQYYHVLVYFIDMHGQKGNKFSHTSSFCFRGFKSKSNHEVCLLRNKVFASTIQKSEIFFTSILIKSQIPKFSAPLEFLQSLLNAY